MRLALPAAAALALTAFAVLALWRGESAPPGPGPAIAGRAGAPTPAEGPAGKSDRVAFDAD